MAYRKRILCLANSRKMGGRCIAGKVIYNGDFGNWIRPVSHRHNHEINNLEMSYRGEGSPRVLDILEVDFLRPVPQDYQVENHLIDDKSRWTFIERVNWNTAADLTSDGDGPLWKNGHSTTNGINDRIPEALTGELSHSLVLIKPVEPILEVTVEPNYNQNGFKYVKRARFNYNNEGYLIKVTDPQVSAEYNSRGEGSYSLQDAIFCISLGVSFEGYAYKLVAAVITP